MNSKYFKVVVWSSVFVVAIVGANGCPEVERNALLKMQQNMSLLENWEGEDCCSWEDVVCSNKTGRVIGITLFPINITNGDAFLPLLSLPHLTHLEINGDYSEGGEIPKFFGSLKTLKSFTLGSFFSGGVPDELGNLTALQSLSIYGDNFIFLENAEWLSRIKSLKYLELDGVNMSKATGWLQALNSLPNITGISLYRCELNSFPPLSHVNFTSLIALDLSFNGIYDQLPNWLGNLTLLEALGLPNNKLEGSLPSTIANLSSLEYLHLSGNQLSGPLPETIGKLSSLKELDLSGNHFNGSLTEAHFTYLSNLTAIILSSNSFSFKVDEDWIPPFQLSEFRMDDCLVGPQFPHWLRTQQSLSLISLSNAGIKGSIPNWYPNSSPSLQYLDLSNNNLHSINLSSFCENNQFINFIGLSKNNFLGELPECWNHINAQYIDFSHNNFHGTIPPTLCSNPNLITLHLSYNFISGPFPACLVNTTSLAVLDLSHNKLTGKIPPWTTNNTLGVLSLGSNSFSGKIPDLSLLQNLQLLDLSDNKFSGSIPHSLGSLKAMTFAFTDQLENSILKAYGMKQELWVMVKGKEDEYALNIIIWMKLIDLSGNCLTGHIPNELMNLHGLQTLNLSGNHLIGQIPINIGELSQLESLDLSRNMLSGPIPPSLASLYFLDHLNLSNNNLSGEIPTGKQLQTFNDTSIYDGNPNLCGFPLEKSCKDDSNHSDNSDEDDEHPENGEGIVWLYMATAPGFVVGFWVFCGTLILNKKWRFAYFQAIDRFYDIFF